ncbi:MAG: hypothetical protein R3336_03460, partial [Phycisphaeraceae bacterium]|nr:hypothetical protein [Phycisphaeraceae bacterium]
MKWGILISLVIVLAIGGLYIATSQGSADSPTRATRAEVLKRLDLPADLPEIFEPAGSSSTSANAIYEQMIQYYTKGNNATMLQRDNPPERVVEKILDYLVRGADASKVQSGLLDQYLPFEPSPKAEYEGALDVVRNLA